MKITSLNYVIAKHHNIISNLNYFSYRLRISKKQISIILMERIHEFIRKNDYLRKELTMYKDIRTTLRKL